MPRRTLILTHMVLLLFLLLLLLLLLTSASFAAIAPAAPAAGAASAAAASAAAASAAAASASFLRSAYSRSRLVQCEGWGWSSAKDRVSGRGQWPRLGLRIRFGLGL